MFASELSTRARRIGALTGVLACGLTAAAVPGTPALAGNAHTRLILLQRSPVKVQGRGFVARRLVTVTVTAAGRSTRTVRVSRTGTFTVTFSDDIPACVAWVISADQARAQNAILRGPRPDCAAP